MLLIGGMLRSPVWVSLHDTSLCLGVLASVWDSLSTVKSSVWDSLDAVGSLSSCELPLLLSRFASKYRACSSLVIVTISLWMFDRPLRNSDSFSIFSPRRSNFVASFPCYSACTLRTGDLKTLELFLKIVFSFPFSKSFVSLFVWIFFWFIIVIGSRLRSVIPTSRRCSHLSRFYGYLCRQGGHARVDAVPYEDVHSEPNQVLKIHVWRLAKSVFQGFPKF